ncbi:hypothetical protein [Streptomyces sp. NPDC059906]|uniref:hypothetical protein n=1 Tax=Streptomyces sp. NPDC059906 TaxID=3346997 RepID=UPI0036628DCE
MAYTVPAPNVGLSGSRGYFSITVKNDGGKVSRKATFKKGPEPKPDLKRGEDLFSEMESYMYDELTRNARSDDVKARVHAPDRVDHRGVEPFPGQVEAVQGVDQVKKR